MLALGTCFAHESHEGLSLLGRHGLWNIRRLASRWVDAIQQWLIRMCELSLVDLDVLQVSALLLLARQTDPVSSELIWISADFPLRIALRLGLHKEPWIHFPEMPPL